jgi:hypothetical protein
MPQTNLELALDCAAKGWPVVPVFEHIKRQYTKDYTTDPAKIVEYWQQWPMARCGVVIGEDSGLIDLDCDDAQAIVTAQQWLADRDIKPVHEFNSPRGKHFLIRWSSELTNQAIGKLQIRVGHPQFQQHVIMRS